MSPRFPDKVHECLSVFVRTFVRTYRLEETYGVMGYRGFNPGMVVSLTDQG